MIDFAIIGAQKAATSSIQSYLKNSSEVFMPDGESAFFEDPDYLNISENLASLSKSGLTTGLKRPDILCNETLIERFSKNVPNAKLIVVFREPISRAISSYYHLARHAHIENLPLNVGFEKCLDDFLLGKDTHYSKVISYGLYGYYLERWFKYYDKGSFLFLSQKDVKQQSEKVMGRISDFLGIKDSSVVSSGGKSKNVGFFNENLIGLHRFGHSLKTRVINDNGRREARGLGPSFLLGSFLVKISYFLSSYVDSEPGVLDDHMKASLREIYSKDLSLLNRLVGSDSVYWEY
jgi:hypothetical protein